MAESIAGIQLIIVDDDPGMRSILRSLTESLGAHILAEAANGREAIEQAKLHRPQLMLLDISMPFMGGFPTARYLREHMPEIRIILVSQHNQKIYAEEALQLGINGYVLKAAAASEISAAIQAVMDGISFVSPHVNR